ncbi:MAG: winged helix DNA-binding domain-containing protein [Cellulomonadaceae bacterium]|nr:winged helix DNA-binding domain-containing protein [Cellulomonadaceae bacterium]
MPDDVLAPAALNRALLARQHLLARAPGTQGTQGTQGTPGAAEAMVAHLVGMQAQNPRSPYVALWSRLEGFSADDLSRRVEDRSVSRIACLRGTIHLVTRQDAVVLPALTLPVQLAQLRANAEHGAVLRSLDLSLLAAVARDLVEEEPRTPVELGLAMASRWPGVAPAALALAARGTLPLVQVTPRGLWRRSGATRWTTVRAWLGAEEEPVDQEGQAAALESLTLRYLAAFGPASVADLQRWCGLTGLGPVVERLRDRLVVFRAEQTAAGRRGRELFDLPDAPRPDASTPAPVRLLADFDNLTLSHADRTRVVSDAHRRRLASPNGVAPGPVLIDGRVAGTWAVSSGRAAGAHRTDASAPVRAALVVTPLEPLTAAQTDAVRSEAEAMVCFVADDATEHRVEVLAAAP